MKDPWIERTTLFDVFKGGRIPEGKKSVSFRIVYRSAARTLSDDEVNNRHQAISASLVEKFKADLPA
jgi:phenylalanyl-tRNA synthetase beta chain